MTFVPNKSLTIEQVLILLEESPLRLAAATNSLAPVKLTAKRDRDQWCYVCDRSGRADEAGFIDPP